MTISADYIARIKSGSKLSQADIVFIRRQLFQDPQSDETQNYLRALALSQDKNPKDIVIIESFLNNDDDYIVEGAIYALCQYWGLYNEYFDFLSKCAAFESWVVRRDLGNMSIGTLAQAYYECKNEKFLAVLYGYGMRGEDELLFAEYKEELSRALKVALFGSVGAFRMGRERNNKSNFDVFMKVRDILGR